MHHDLSDTPKTPFGNLDIAYLGTFWDCLQTPVHRWFKYPAGFSYRLVETLITEFRLTQSKIITCVWDIYCVFRFA